MAKHKIHMKREARTSIGAKREWYGAFSELELREDTSCEHVVLPAIARRAPELDTMERDHGYLCG